MNILFLSDFKISIEQWSKYRSQLIVDDILGNSFVSRTVSYNWNDPMGEGRVWYSVLFEVFSRLINEERCLWFRCLSGMHSLNIWLFLVSQWEVPNIKWKKWVFAFQRTPHINFQSSVINIDDNRSNKRWALDCKRFQMKNESLSTKEVTDSHEHVP